VNEAESVVEDGIYITLAVSMLIGIIITYKLAFSMFYCVYLSYEHPFYNMQRLFCTTDSTKWSFSFKLKIVAQLLSKFFAFYGTQRFFTAFTGGHPT
jgi:hypothetical protein